MSVQICLNRRLWALICFVGIGLLYWPPAFSLENPAWRSCAEAGGRSTVFYKAGEAANQWRVCAFDDLSWCLAWDVHDGSCAKGQQACRFDESLNFCLPPEAMFCHWRAFRDDSCHADFYAAKENKSLMALQEKISVDFQSIELGMLVQIFEDTFDGLDIEFETQSIAAIELTQLKHKDIPIEALMKVIASEHHLAIAIEGGTLTLFASKTKSLP